MQNGGYLSEDDIRTKVVYVWLKNCGVSEKEIFIEYSINIRLGRGVKTIHSRSDVLVRTVDGKNLLIIEVKKYNHKLHANEKDQAISYARSLAEGGIAPFAILTNGTETIIFDSITGLEIEGETILSEHKYIKNGFKVSNDVLSTRAEALEYLLAVSEENLMIFCRSQALYRMSLLKSDDIYSGKKYIPELYVEPERAVKDIEKKMYEKTSEYNSLLVVGPPQHGKTCFLCNTAEKLLERNVPCLFYPAISLRKGLMQEMLEDFQSHFNENISIYQVINKFNKLLGGINEKIYIFIDGWNEMINDALLLNDECQKMYNKNIKFIISTTSSSLDRLLKDGSDNLTYLASITKLNPAAIKKLIREPLVDDKDYGVVQIGKFSDEELECCKKKHEIAYNVKFLAGINLPDDPFYIRLASEQYVNGTVPIFATRTDLIRESLVRKAARRGIDCIELFRGLNQVAKIIIKKGDPFDINYLPDSLSDRGLFACWIESAILILLNEYSSPIIDFYYTHDKNYSIAIIYKKWNEAFIDPSSSFLLKELSYISKNESLKNALKWFLNCPEYCVHLEKLFSVLEIEFFLDNPISSILSESILHQVNLNKSLTFIWLEKYIDKILALELNKVTKTTEFAELIYSLVLSIDKIKNEEKYNFWLKMLLKYDTSFDELGIDESFSIKAFGEEDIRSWDGYTTSADIEILEVLILDSDIVVASRSALCLAYICQNIFLENVPNIYKIHVTENIYNFYRIILPACCLIIDGLSDVYYGDMGCPGMLTDHEEGDELIIEEFYLQKKLWKSIMRLIKADSELFSSVNIMLNNLATAASIGEDSLEVTFFDPNQLEIEF